MSALERWLIAGLVVLAIAFAGVALWQQSRYAGAQSAVREFVRLEQTTDRKEGDSRALARAARPEIRRHLVEGDFPAAQKRLAALRAEESAPEDPEISGKGIAMEALWPPNSKERESARLVLKRLVERQAQGYEMAPAHAALVRVAEEARKGDRKRALAAFHDVEKQVTTAVLRPGFQPAHPVPQRGGRGDNPGTAPDRGPPPLTDRQIQGVQRMFQFIRPEMLEQVPEERRAFLRRVQPLGDEIAEAHRHGRDVRPLVRSVYPMMQALRAGEMDQAEALLEKIRAAIPTLPPRPAAAPNPRGGPSGALGSGFPGAAPRLPALPTLPGGGLPAVSPERILQALDSIRALPEAEYQQQRPTMAVMLAQVLGAGSGTVRAEPAASAVTVGDPTQLSLDLSPRGEINGLRARGAPLSTGLPAGGYFRIEEGKPEISLAGPLRKTAQGTLQRSAGRDGNFKAVYRVDGKELVLQAETRRDREGPPGAVVLRLPLRAGGWRWTAGPEPAVIAIDQNYEAKPGEGGTLPVTIGGLGFGLSILAPGAESVRLEPGEGRLSIRFPIPKSRGTTTSVVRLRVVAPGE